jgi:hypothetical protein
MSFEDAVILAACSLLLAMGIAFLPRPRRGELLERPESQLLEFDPLVLDGDGPVLDLEPA